MTCEDVRSELVSFVRGELDPAEREALSAHLAGCLSCRNEAAALEGRFETAAEAFAVDPSAGFRSRVLQAARREGLGRRSGRVAAPESVFRAFLGERVRKAPILVAAIAVHAAAIVLLAGVYIPVRLARPRPVLLDPGLPAVPETGSKLEEVMGNLPAEFEDLPDPLKRAEVPAMPAFPWHDETQVGPAPDPRPGPGPAPGPNPQDFGQRVGRAPARADVLGWFGARADETKKAGTLEGLGAERAPALVARGLKWLAEAQDETGRIDPVPFGGQETFETGITALALLAFLGDGHSCTRGTWAKQVSRGIVRLLEVQDPETGRYGPAKGNYLYNHGIALLAVCEAFGMGLLDAPGDRTMLAPLAASARRGVQFLLDTQCPSGGWGYTALDRESDSSVTAWPVAALATALKLNLAPAGKAPRTERALERAARWYRTVTHPATGAVGYRARGSYKTGPESLTAVSLYCGSLYRLETAPPEPGLRDRQVRLVTALDPSGAPKPDFYFWYYAAFGLRSADDASFRPFFASLARVLETLQEPDGGFPRRSLYGEYGGRCYTTAMAVLALEAPWRFPRR